MNPIKLAFYSLFAIIFCLFLQGNNNQAFAADIYTVGNVLIEAGGSNATEARAAAIDKGQVQAFSLVLQNLNVPSFTVSPAQASRMVQGFEVSDEKISNDHYQALLSVSFSPAAVRTLLEQHKLAAPAAASSSSVLLLPLFKQGGDSMLWEDNPWHDALAVAIQAGGKGNLFKLPLGDLSDMGLIDDNTVLTSGFTPLRGLAAKYGAEKVIIAQAQPITDKATGKITLEITVITATSAQKTQQIVHIDGVAGENITSLLKKGAENIVTIPKVGAEAAIPVIPPGNLITINAHFPSLAAWLKIKNALAVEGKLQQMDIKRLSAQDAVIEVYFQGDKAALIQHLGQKSIIARQEKEGLVIDSAAP